MKVALAEYVTLRKIILERLSHLLELKDTKAHPEKAIHDLIFPQRVDTESNPGAEHHLWIIDERLESHNYLASDQPIDAKDGDRPDLLIALDRPSAFASDSPAKSKGYERIALVEFKRALKDLAKIPTDDLPHRQMMRYPFHLDGPLCPLLNHAEVLAGFYAEDGLRHDIKNFCKKTAWPGKPVVSFAAPFFNSRI